MSRERYDHIHIYRAVTEKLRMYKCTVTGCPHTMNASSLVGMKARCDACDGQLIVTEDNLRRRNIRHIGCGGRVGSAVHMKPTAPFNPSPKVNIVDIIRRIKTG